MVDPPLKAWIDGADRLVVIEWHIWWPDPFDPYYQATMADAQARGSDYSVTSAPSIRFGGTKRPPSFNEFGYNFVYDGCTATESPIALDVSGTYDSSSRSGVATVTVTPDAALGGEPRLYAALTESATLDEFPNGIDVHDDLLRQFLGPDETVLTFSGSTDEAIAIDVPFSIGTSWATSNVKLVYFVQDAVTLDVVQAGAVRIPDLMPGTPVTTTSWPELKARF